MAVEKPSVIEVKVAIPATSALSDGQVQAAINTAALVVERCISSLDEELQKEIVMYWAAGMLADMGVITGGGAITSDRLGDASRTFAQGGGKKVASNSYKQIAIDLDPSGCLSRIGKGRATAEVLRV